LRLWYGCTRPGAQLLFANPPARTSGRALGFGCALKAAACAAAGGDSPEFVTITCTGGVAHPPGYPLLSLLSGLFARVLTVGSVAWRCGCPRLCVSSFS
jgi:hypothetical protein